MLLCTYITLELSNQFTTNYPNTKYSMIYISYLGVYDGQNFEKANTPNQIGTAITSGFSCMINVWRIGGNVCVGTQNNPIVVPERSIQGPRYIINAMNTDMQNWLQTQPSKLYPSYFWFPTAMENTNVVTSNNKIITPGTVPVNNTSIMFLPEITDRGLLSTVKLRCFGVISNYLTFIKRMRNEGTWY